MMPEAGRVTDCGALREHGDRVAWLAGGRLAASPRKACGRTSRSRLPIRAGPARALATILGSGLAQLDGSVVNVALPRIGENLGAGLTSLQWTINAYTLTLSGLLLLGGSLGDRLGRRRIFLVGVVWFALASAGCALAPTSGVLIAMRALQGVGAALLTPGSLAILEAVFRRPDRAPAIGRLDRTWRRGHGPWSRAWRRAGGPRAMGLAIGVLDQLAAGSGGRRSHPRGGSRDRDEEATGTLDVPGALLAAVGRGRRHPRAHRGTRHEDGRPP